MIIENVEINNNSPVFIIAELSANHNGSIDTAIETIRAAKRAGADCIKLQTYTADTMTIASDKKDFIIKGSGCIGAIKTKTDVMISFTKLQEEFDYFDLFFSREKVIELRDRLTQFIETEL